MLRLTVLLLLLANAAYFGWSQGLLAPWGIAPAQQSEPDRLRQQIKPNALRILGGEEAGRLELTSAGAKAAECLQAGLFEEAQVAGLKQVLSPWPAGSWVFEPGLQPARWIVYLGRFPGADNLARQKAELRQIGVAFEDVSEASLQPGLSLGGSGSEAAARQQLDLLAQRGVRGAKVVQENSESRGQLLKLPAVDDSLRARLGGLQAALGARSLRPCR